MYKCYYHPGLINENQDLVSSFIKVKTYSCLHMKATLLNTLSIGTIRKFP